MASKKTFHRHSPTTKTNCTSDHHGFKIRSKLRAGDNSLCDVCDDTLCLFPAWGICAAACPECRPVE
jgi:hypothetical protein